jgi:hypothetical protein
MEKPSAGISGWFWGQLLDVLHTHSSDVDLGYLQGKYAGLPREEIARRRIRGAAGLAALVGLASGAAISIAEGAALLSAWLGPVSIPVVAVALPVSVLAFAFELILVLRIQLRLAYDLFLLYELPTDIHNPEQVQEIVGVALGIKSAELAGQALQKIVPQVGPVLLRKAMPTGIVKRRLQEWVARRFTRQYARRYVAQGVLIRALVPGIALVTAAGWDYLSTRAIGKTLQGRVTRRVHAAIEADQLALERVKNPKLLLEAVLTLPLPDGGLSESGLSFYRRLVERLRTLYGDAAVDQLTKDFSFDWSQVTSRLSGVREEEEKRIVYDGLATAAVVGGQLGRKKRKRLQEVADLYDIPFDARVLRAKLAPYNEPRPARTCLLVVLALFVVMMSSCVACGLGAWLPVLYQAAKGG